jgi:hypothetical protein
VTRVPKQAHAIDELTGISVKPIVSEAFLNSDTVRLEMDGACVREEKRWCEYSLAGSDTLRARKGKERQGLEEYSAWKGIWRLNQVK